MAQELEQQEAAMLAELEDMERQAAEASRSALADERIQVPLLAKVQGTSKNPPKEAKLGDFVNTVTGAVYGNDIEFLIAVYNRGRFMVELDEDGERTGRTFVAGNDSVVPGNWPEQYRGRVFADLPEAEETFKQNVNDGVHQWGHGPLINTTYNFTGVVTRSAVTDEEPIPVRLSMMRSDVPAARTIITMLKSQRTMWARAIHLTTERVQGNEGAYFATKVEDFGDEPTLVQRRQAAELALAADQVGLREVGDPAEGSVEGTATEETEENRDDISF